MPEVKPTIRVDVIPGSGITYIGEAAPGADTFLPLWRIKKIITTTASGTDVSITWANGSNLPGFTWDDHLTLTYF